MLEGFFWINTFSIYRLSEISAVFSSLSKIVKVEKLNCVTLPLKKRQFSQYFDIIDENCI